MRFLRIALPALLVTTASFGQLSQSQKVADFMQLAGDYAVNYGPYEWKVQNYGFDLFNLKPWLDQIAATKTDLAFYDVMIHYVASLHDNHDEFSIPSDYVADLHFSTDLYDGKPLIDYLDRSYLPARKYPFQIGDELVSVDGVSTQDLITKYLPYAVNGHGNPLLEQRIAVELATTRVQGIDPYAANISDSATVVIRRQSGALETYTIAWDVTGTAITNVGLIPPFKTTGAGPVAHLSPSRVTRPDAKLEGANGRAWHAWSTFNQPKTEVPVTAASAARTQLRHARVASPLAQVDFDRFTPVFNPPAGFKTRLGTRVTDEFLSGTFPLGSKVIGFIRIPSFTPNSYTNAYNQWASEMAYFRANTDALVVDVMRNGGGDLCYIQPLMSFLVPQQFWADGLQIRATLGWQQGFSQQLTYDQQTGADQWVIDLDQAYLKEIQQAMSESRGMTGTLPICSDSFMYSPAQDSKGNNIAYTKPMVLLTDGATFSAADFFSAYMADSKRATIVGERTAGAGGNVVSYDAGTFSQGSTRVTQSLGIRAQSIQNPGFPASLYIENTGVVPDVAVTYNTMDNLLNGGKPFVTAVTNVLNGLLGQ